MRFNRPSLILLSITLLSYSSAMFIYWLDNDFVFRWIVLACYLLSIGSILTSWIYSLLPHVNKPKTLVFINFIGLLIITVSLRLLFIIDYPFVSYGDELREAGLYSQRVSNAHIKDFFSYGAYDGYGLIIPTITSFLYDAFGSSILVYRLPAAIVGIADVLVVFFLIWLITKNIAGSFIGALALSTLPLHLYYSRTELVVILSSLFSSILLLALFVLIQKKSCRIIDYIFLGTLIGITFNLYSGIKAMGLVMGPVIILIALFQLFIGKFNFTKFTTIIVMFFTSILIGFGPLIFNTSIDNFFNTKRLTIVNQETDYHYPNSLHDLGEKYAHSLLVWISKPTNAWYPDHQPIYTPIIFLFFITGLISGVLKKNVYLFIVIAIALVLHLTNSAFTDVINGDHRISPLYPVGSIFVGIGITTILALVRFKPIQYLIIVIMSGYLSLQSIKFFTLQSASLIEDVQGYLSIHSIRHIKINKDLYHDNNISIQVSPDNFITFSTLHYQEQYEYFLPDKNISITEKSNLTNHEIYIISENQDSINTKKVVDCKQYKFHCPIDYPTNLVIYY